MHAVKVYKMRGISDDTDTCDLCGKTGLVRVVMLDNLDAEGNMTGIVSYFGTYCASLATGWTQSRVRAEIRDAERAKQEAERERREAEHRTKMDDLTVRYRAWLLETFGSTDDKPGGYIRQNWSIRGVLWTQWCKGITEFPRK